MRTIPDDYEYAEHPMRQISRTYFRACPGCGKGVDWIIREKYGMVFTVYFECPECGLLMSGRKALLDKIAAAHGNSPSPECRIMVEKTGRVNLKPLVKDYDYLLSDFSLLKPREEKSPAQEFVEMDLKIRKYNKSFIRFLPALTGAVLLLAAIIIVLAS